MDLENLIKILGIGEINYLYMDYTDKHGNFKELRLDNRHETLEDRGG